MAEIGDLTVWTKTFTNAAGAAANPDRVSFFIREEVDGTELEWGLDGDDTDPLTPTGMSAIDKEGTGVFTVTFVARKPERITGWWRGAGTIFQARPLTVFVRHSLIHAIETQ